MIKTLSNIFKQDKEKFIIPRSVQQVIPIETIWSDGIFKIGRNKFARTYKFTDINYAVASKVDKGNHVPGIYGLIKFVRLRWNNKNNDQQSPLE